MKPVYDEISFLYSLCKAAKNGTFQPNLGIRVRKGRIERERARQTMDQTGAAQRDGETKEQRQKRKERGKERITQIRKTLGMRSRPVEQTKTRKS